MTTQNRAGPSAPTRCPECGKPTESDGRGHVWCHSCGFDSDGPTRDDLAESISVAVYGVHDADGTQEERARSRAAADAVAAVLSLLQAENARLRDALESVELRAHFEAKGKDGSWADVMRWARSALAGCTCDSRTFGGPLCSTHPLPRP